jgi:transcriptional regulator with XRE-family HTH domain
MLGNLYCNVGLEKPTIGVMSEMIPNSPWERFGPWIRQKRREADLTQAEVAKRAKIHEVQLARIEKAESGTKWSTVIHIAKAIGIPAEEALNMAGFSLTSDDGRAVYQHGLIIPAPIKRPRNVVEFLAILESLGDVTFNIDRAALVNYTEEDFHELLERIKTDIEITVRRKKK